MPCACSLLTWTTYRLKSQSWRHWVLVRGEGFLGVSSFFLLLHPNLLLCCWRANLRHCVYFSSDIPCSYLPAGVRLFWERRLLPSSGWSQRTILLPPLLGSRDCRCHTTMSSSAQPILASLPIFPSTLPLFLSHPTYPSACPNFAAI